jgi:N-acyl-D-aspartate/D-glutamate deacylase
VERKKVLGERGIKAPELWHPATFNYIVYSRTYPHLEGKNLAEAAKILKFENFWDAARKIYLDDEGTTLTAAGFMCEEDIITILKHPVSSISTDGAAYDILPDTTSPLAWCHPRNFGTFAKVLQRYVREMKLLSLEEAVRKMTSLPLRFLGIQDRGLIQEGLYADITIFDAQKITNLATYANPAVYPQGIHYVLVNGQVALDNGKETGSLSGKVLSRN